MKQLLFERINSELAPARAEYERLVASPGEVEKLLLAGAERARALKRRCQKSNDGSPLVPAMHCRR